MTLNNNEIVNVTCFIYPYPNWFNSPYGRDSVLCRGEEHASGLSEGLSLYAIVLYYPFIDPMKFPLHLL